MRRIHTNIHVRKCTSTLCIQLYKRERERENTNQSNRNNRLATSSIFLSSASDFVCTFMVEILFFITSPCAHIYGKNHKWWELSNIYIYIYNHIASHGNSLFHVLSLSLPLSLLKCCHLCVNIQMKIKMESSNTKP